MNDLAKLQKTLLSMLVDFDSFCRENNIEYYLIAGTLIGAVRHKGFIPWDDDIDLAMTREQYEKFHAIRETFEKDKYFIQDYSTEKSYYFSFSKIRKMNTDFPQEMNENLNINTGIFIDIFILDSTKSVDSINVKVQAKLHDTLQKNYYY